MFDKMFRTIIVAGISFTICSSGSISSCELPRMARKTQRKYSRNGNNEDELDLQNDEEYDGFLDDVVVDSAWNIEDDSLVTLTGQTGDEFESFPFSLSFYFENREFQLQYEFESEWVEETSTAHVDKNGGLTADLTFERDSGEAHFDLTEYKNLSKLERLINNAKKDEPISACGLFGLSWRRISAIIAIYVVVAETAEQIRAKSNRKYNENLEQNGRGC